MPNFLHENWNQPRFRWPSLRTINFIYSFGRFFHSMSKFSFWNKQIQYKMFDVENSETKMFKFKQLVRHSSFAILKILTTITQVKCLQFHTAQKPLCVLFFCVGHYYNYLTFDITMFKCAMHWYRCVSHFCAHESFACSVYIVHSIHTTKEQTSFVWMRVFACVCVLCCAMLYFACNSSDRFCFKCVKQGVKQIKKTRRIRECDFAFNICWFADAVECIETKSDPVDTPYYTVYSAWMFEV